MGAAGYVTIYRRKDVESKWKEKHPDKDIEKDWWYLNTITVTLDGTQYVFDYGDDQGYHEGVANDFWFESRDAQERVLKVLRECKAVSVEVWT